MPPPAFSRPALPSLLQGALPYALIALAALAAYGNSFGNEFLFDDEFLIQKNSFIRSWAYLGDIFSTSSTAGVGTTDSFYRPLQIFLYLLVYQLAGLSAPAFHALNLGLHMLNGGLVFRLGRTLGLSPVPGLAASLLWVLHPIHTEAVTYMSATADPLHVSLILAGLLAWFAPAAPRRMLACLFFALALLAKEAAIVFPALIVVVALFTASPGARLRAAAASWPLWLMAALYLLLRATLLDFDDSFVFIKESTPYTDNPLVRLATFLALYPYYFVLLLAPHNLHMERMALAFGSFDSPPVLIGAALLLLATFFALRALRRGPPPGTGFGLAWFFAAYFPCSGILMPMNSLFLEHWMYLPSIGLFLGVAAALERGLRGEALRTAALAVAAACALLLGFSTFQQNRVWADALTLYTHILKFENGSARIYNNLAMIHDMKGDIAGAEALYRKSIALWDVYPQTHYNYGNILLRRGQEEEAIAEYRRALEMDPTFFRAAGTLMKIYARRKMMDEAERYRQLYLKHAPQHPVLP